MRSTEEIKQILKVHTAELMALPGVVGVAIGETEDQAACLLVMALSVTDELRDILPPSLDDVPVRLVETGEIKPL